MLRFVVFKSRGAIEALRHSAAAVVCVSSVFCYVAGKEFVLKGPLCLLLSLPAVPSLLGPRFTHKG